MFPWRMGSNNLDHRVLAVDAANGRFCVLATMRSIPARLLLDQTIFRSKCIELYIAKECR